MQLRAFLLIIALLSSTALYAEQFSISYVEANDKPVVDSGRITYSMDIVFRERPSFYWVYYDERIEKIVIDFYGLSLFSPKIVFPKTAIFRDFSAVNLTTRMSLSGERAQILIGTDPGWSITASSVHKNAIRVKMWKRLKPTAPRKRSKAPMLLAFIVTPLAVGAATFFIMRSLND